jgi:hypothetical protein
MVLKSRYTLAASDVPDLPLHAALFERLKTFGDGVALVSITYRPSYCYQITVL